MPMPICLELEALEDPPSLTLPGGITLQQYNLLQAIQPALTPLVPVFEIVDTVVAVFNCIKAIPDVIGPPPDPTVLAACLPELAQKVNKLIRLMPQLALPYTVKGILQVLMDALVQARNQLAHLQKQLGQLQGAAQRGRELGDAGLMAITACAQANVATEAANVGKSLASLGKLVGLANLFLGMIAQPLIPDFSTLDGKAIDEAVAPIDDLVSTLRRAHAAIPLP